MGSRCVAALVAALAFVVLAPAGCLGVGDTSANEPKKDAGTNVDASGLADGGWLCTPKTCADLKADCGDTSDQCGKLISCGSCKSGETCGAAGPNRCGVGSCTPSSCASAGAACGLLGDGCGKTLDCGSCQAPAQCGAGGIPNQCACVPTTCALAGKECGSISDGCGGNLSCGACPGGKTCSASNVCTCTPTTCAAQAKNCGSIPDGCGGTLDCGSCIAPSTCGALGTPNVCACTPQACPPIYQNSFESSADFPTGWDAWQNCPTDSTWSIQRDLYPAPSGGSYGLRLHTTGFVASCQYPGAYTDTPALQALPGRSYKVSLWTRNASSLGATTLIFFDSADSQVGMQQGAWSSDAWQYKAQPVLSGVSPAGTASLRVRIELWSPSAYADVDLLEVDLEPL